MQQVWHKCIVYEEFAEWCEESSNNVMFDIKTRKGNVADLHQTIDKECANIAVQGSAIEHLAGQIATDEGDLRAVIDFCGS